MNNDIYFTEMASRALLGDLKNITEMCLQDQRPRAQYMHYYRKNSKKILDLLNNWSGPKDERYYYLNLVSEYYKTHPKCTFDTQKQLSEDIKQIIQNYERGNQN
jgi:hypothetical protein